MKQLLLITGVLLLQSSNWQDADYAEYDSREFFAREDVHRQIDLNALDKNLLEAAVFYATNTARNAEGKSMLRFDTHLYAAARKHSEDMRKFQFIDHINTRDKNRRTPMMRIEQEGGNFIGTAENIARVNVLQLGKGESYFVDEKGRKIDRHGKELMPKTYAELARGVVDGWMHSKHHRENILGSYSYLGCGVAHISYSANNLPEILITQNFGKK